MPLKENKSFRHISDFRSILLWVSDKTELIKVFFLFFWGMDTQCPKLPKKSSGEGKNLFLLML